MNPELRPQLLLRAYSRGIFPMADEYGRISWFCPEPRAIIELDRFHVSRTLRQVCRQQRFTLTVNQAFERVITRCADRPEGTWISEEIVEAYTRLHQLGRAHSVEAWQSGELAGGLYGVSVGGVFCGESMFHERRDASKVALVFLVERLKERGYRMLDIQFMTDHLARFGAVEIPRDEYLRRLKEALGVKAGFGAPRAANSGLALDD